MKTTFIWCILVHIACLRSLQQDGAMLASIIFPLAYFSSHFQYIFCPTFYIFFNTFKPYFQPISTFSVYFIPPTHPQKTNTNQLYCFLYLLIVLHGCKRTFRSPHTKLVCCPILLFLPILQTIIMILSS